MHGKYDILKHYHTRNIVYLYLCEAMRKREKGNIKCLYYMYLYYEWIEYTYVIHTNTHENFINDIHAERMCIIPMREFSFMNVYEWNV